MSYLHMAYGDAAVRFTIPRDLTPEALDDYLTRARHQLVAAVNELDPQEAPGEVTTDLDRGPEGDR